MSHDHKITALVSIQVSPYDNANVDTGMFEQRLIKNHSNSLSLKHNITLKSRVVKKISSWRVNTSSTYPGNQTSEGVSLGSIFLLFSFESNQGATFIVVRENRWPYLLMTALQEWNVTVIVSSRT